MYADPTRLRAPQLIFAADALAPAPPSVQIRFIDPYAGQEEVPYKSVLLALFLLIVGSFFLVAGGVKMFKRTTGACAFCPNLVPPRRPTLPRSLRQAMAVRTLPSWCLGR